MTPTTYTIGATPTPPELDAAWGAGAWAGAQEGRITHFHEKGSAHRPDTLFRLLHDNANIYVQFEVQDRYVRSVQTAYQGSVCTDSCVEFFVQPRPDRGYFNFEINAGGTLLLFYIEDATRTPNGFAKFGPVAEAWGRQVQIRHSLPSVVEPECAEPLTWRIGYRVPVALLEAYTGALGPISGQTWRANFYKCGDKTSHPHWGSWAPITELNFHLPACFGSLVLQ
ncbi:MAG: carbohydrate-binding family 9-like protein [bacterium]